MDDVGFVLEQFVGLLMSYVVIRGKTEGFRLGRRAGVGVSWAAIGLSYNGGLEYYFQNVFGI